MYKPYKYTNLFIEDDCNKWTNHQQRTTSTINEIVLMKKRVLDDMDGREGRG